MSCPLCRDTGWRAHVVEGVERYSRCDCWRQGLVRGLLGEARIPERYRKCDFTTLVEYPNEPMSRAVRKARAFSDAFPVVERGILLIGPPGIGKTHLAVSVLREVVRKGFRGLYYDTRTLLSELRGSFDPVTRSSGAEILEAVRGAELLVLDDLGAERFTDWVEETMNLIVNARYNEKRHVVFTSNYQDLPGDGDDETDGALKERVGFRMHSRLYEMCDFLEYDGPDYRDFEHPPDADILRQKWEEKRRRRPYARRSRREHLPGRSSGPVPARPTEALIDLGWSGGKAVGDSGGG